MPTILITIGVWLASVIGPLIARALLALGMGVVTYTGATVAVDQALAYVQTSWSGMPAAVVGILALAGFDKFITIVLSAYASALALKAASGSMKKLTFTNSSPEV